MPSTSDDASHNEALSSRIAALNMLDLGLEHLDVDVGHANRAEVDAVVRTCGQSKMGFVSRVPSSASHLVFQLWRNWIPLLIAPAKRRPYWFLHTNLSLVSVLGIPGILGADRC